MKFASYLSLALLLCSSAFAGPREEFTAALKTLPAAEADSAELRAYALHPYLTATRLRARLPQADEALDTEIAAFLKSDGALGLRQTLRREWLNSLAQRKMWPAFLAQAREVESDAALRCHQLQAWIETGGMARLREDLMQFWLSAKPLPKACEAPFEWLRAQGQLTPARHAERTRAALAAREGALAEWLIAAAPAEEQPALKRSLALQRSPLAEIKALVSKPAPRPAWDEVREAWSRLARQSPTPLEALVEPLTTALKLNAEQQAVLRQHIALGHALDRTPGALPFYAQSRAAPYYDRAAEWELRAALWAGDWTRTLDSLTRLPAEAPRTRYWRARALAATGAATEAQTLYQGLLDTRNVYGFFAARALDQGLAPQSQPAPENAELRASLAAQPALQRAQELVALQQMDWASAEWRSLNRSWDSAQHLEGARIATAWGWNVQAVASFRTTGLPDDHAFLYPAPFGTEVKRAADFAKISPDWVYAVMRQESLFLPTAVSKADAFGLLQLLLPTARAVAKRWQQPRPTREDLFQPDINLPLGAAYLREMTDKFGGQFLLTLAAYNAGPGAVARWLPPAPMAADVWIENIPFNETRDYVQRILWNVLVYRTRANGQPDRLDDLILPVRTP